MANPYLRAHGATVKFGNDAAIDNATIIGIPGDEYDLIEKPALDDDRIQWDLSDTPDSPEISVTVPYGATLPSITGTVITIIIVLPKPNKTVTFSGLVIRKQPLPAEVNGLHGIEIGIKPTSVAAIT